MQIMTDYNIVPKPWTPISVTEDDNGIIVSVLGRTYNFGNEMFPVSITANGEELLSSPISLIGEDNGVALDWIHKETWVQNQYDGRITICSAMESRFAVISSFCEIDYDGYMKFTFRLSTRGIHVRSGFDRTPDKEKRIINKLWLDIPLKKDKAKLSHNGSWYTGTDSGFTKEGNLCFKPVNWYGCEKCGLGVYFDSDENWQSIEKKKAIEIIDKDNSFVIRHHLLDFHPRKWDVEENMMYNDKELANTRSYGLNLTPLTYVMGIQATPTKPYDESILKEKMIHIDCFARIERDYLEFFTDKVSESNPLNVLEHLKESGVTTIILHQCWNKIQGYWELGRKDSQRIQTLIDLIHKNGMKVLFYFCNSISTLAPVSEEYILRNSHIRHNGTQEISFYRTPPQRTYRTCANGPDVFKNLTEGMSRFLTEYNADGVYIYSADIPWECTNHLHGCGYTDSFGIKHPTYPVHTMREAFKKIYIEIHEKLGKTIQLHPYNAFIPSIHTYCDLYWNGEQFVFKNGTNSEGIIKSLDEGFMMTEMLGRNIGTPCQLLAYNLPDNSWNLKMANAISIPYGTYPRPIDIHSTLDDMTPVWKALDEFKAWECSFTGYYEGNNFAECDNDTIKISKYENETNFVLAITNPSLNQLKNIKITSKYPALKELIKNVQLTGKEFTLDFEPFDSFFVMCDKSL